MNNHNSGDSRSSGQTCVSSFIPDPKVVRRFQNEIGAQETDLDTYWRRSMAGEKGYEPKATSSAAKAYSLRKQLKAYTNNSTFDPNSLVPIGGGTTAEELDKSRGAELENASGLMTALIRSRIHRSIATDEDEGPDLLNEALRCFSLVKEYEKLRQSAIEQNNTARDVE